MAFKLVVSDPKTRRAYQKEVDEKASGLIGKKLGDKVPGEPLGLAGFELELTGGSDKDGFPMRSDIDGVNRKRALVIRGLGMKDKVKGLRKRKSVRGNTISTAVSQINAKVIKYGPKSVEETLGVTPKEPKKKEEKTEKPAAETKE